MICVNDNVVLLITGCITPDVNVPEVVLKDPQKRRQQYIDSIRYYISHSKVKNIIYCDNSEAQELSDLYALANEKNKNFEWLSFQGDKIKCIKKGKGYGEGEIIQYCLKYSEVIKKCDYLIKITGRLQVININFLISCAKESEIYFWPNQTADDRHYINTRIYMMPIVTYKKYFINAHEMVDDKNGVYLEHTFGNCCDKYNLAYKKFLVCPLISGISGSTGRTYRPTIYQEVKDTIKMYLYRR